MIGLDLQSAFASVNMHICLKKKELTFKNKLVERNVLENWINSAPQVFLCDPMVQDVTLEWLWSWAWGDGSTLSRRPLFLVLTRMTLYCENRKNDTKLSKKIIYRVLPTGAAVHAHVCCVWARYAKIHICLTYSSREPHKRNFNSSIRDIPPHIIWYKPIKRSVWITISIFP